MLTHDHTANYAIKSDTLSNEARQKNRRELNQSSGHVQHVSIIWLHIAIVGHRGHWAKQSRTHSPHNEGMHPH